MTLIPKFKAKFKKATSIIGFLNHLQGDLKMKAVEAGCDTVMPRSAFSQSLPNLLRRYGVEEEEEIYTQPVFCEARHRYEAEIRTSRKQKRRARRLGVPASIFISFTLVPRSLFHSSLATYPGGQVIDRPPSRCR